MACLHWSVSYYHNVTWLVLWNIHSKIEQVTFDLWMAKDYEHSQSHVFPGSQWNYSGLLEHHSNQTPAGHQALVDSHQQSKDYFKECLGPTGILSDERKFEQEGRTSGACASVRKRTSKIFLCEFCNATFTSGIRLKEHINILHLNKKYSYTCPICGKGFTRKYRFNDHVNAHNNIKAHTCPKCSRSFTQLTNLNTHIRCGTCDKWKYKHSTTWFCLGNYPYRLRTSVLLCERWELVLGFSCHSIK